jgi:hypothetical protein
MLYFSSQDRICWICGKTVSSAGGRNDELGYPVHQPCLDVRAALARAALLSTKKPPSRSTGSRTRKGVLGCD